MRKIFFIASTLLVLVFYVFIYKYINEKDRYISDGIFIQKETTDDGYWYYLSYYGRDMLQGELEGRIRKIGWNKDYIACDVKTYCLGDVSGIYLIRKSNKEILGVINEESIKDKIIMLNPDDAYMSLPFFRKIEEELYYLARCVKSLFFTIEYKEVRKDRKRIEKIINYPQ